MSRTPGGGLSVPSRVVDAKLRAGGLPRLAEKAASAHPRQRVRKPKPRVALWRWCPRFVLGRVRDAASPLCSRWGGNKVARNLDGNKFDVRLVSPSNHFLFTSFLPATAVGAVPPAMRGAKAPTHTHSPRTATHRHARVSSSAGTPHAAATYHSHHPTTCATSRR